MTRILDLHDAGGRARRGRSAALLLALALLGACGGGDAGDEDADAEPKPTGPLAAVESALSEVRSGHIELALLASTPGAEPVGFEMEGEFAVSDSEDELPIADLTYTERRGADAEITGFVADGEKAWIVTERKVSPVEGERLGALKGGEDVAGLEGLHPSKWLTGEVTETPAEPVDLQETTSYEGEVDALAVLNDIIGLAGNLGGDVPSTLEGPEAERVREAIKSAELELVAGAADDLIRRVSYSADLEAATEGEDLTQALGDLAAVRIEFNLELSEVNEPVDPPDEPQPLGTDSGETTTTTGDESPEPDGGDARTTTTTRPRSTTTTTARSTTTETTAEPSTTTSTA